MGAGFFEAAVLAQDVQNWVVGDYVLASVVDLGIRCGCGWGLLVGMLVLEWWRRALERRWGGLGLRSAD